MKTANELFVTVILRQEVLTSQVHFVYEDAKKYLLEEIGKSPFELNFDDAIIFLHDGSGTGEAVFNYRAYMNGEPDRYTPPLKENKYVKRYFECPYCKCKNSSVQVDRDGDMVSTCLDCKKDIPFY